MKLQRVNPGHTPAIFRSEDELMDVTVWGHDPADTLKSAMRGDWRSRAVGNATGLDPETRVWSTKITVYVKKPDVRVSLVFRSERGNPFYDGMQRFGDLSRAVTKGTLVLD